MQVIQPTCVGHKKFLPNDFDYIPFGRTYVYYDLKKLVHLTQQNNLLQKKEVFQDRKDIINTKNSVKEMITIHLGNKDDKKRQGIVIAAPEDPVGQNLVLFKLQIKNLLYKYLALLVSVLLYQKNKNKNTLKKRQHLICFEGMTGACHYFL